MTRHAWLPNLFILGVPKAGTTSLHNWLVAHPDADGARSKEAQFFIDPQSHVFRADFNSGLGLDIYQKEFAHCTAPVILDSTPAYLYQQAALDHIPGLDSAPRCLVVVRDPAEQILSLYRYFRDNWNDVPTQMSFAEFVAVSRAGNHPFGGNELARDALRNAHHAAMLRPWRARLGPDRLMVRSFDELRAAPRAFTASVARWAGLDPAFYENFDFPRENETLAPRVQWLQRLNIAVRARLPDGAVYRMARNLYRRVNLQRQEIAAAEAKVMEALRAEFEEANAELSRDYGIDVSGWQPKAKTQPDRTVS